MKLGGWEGRKSAENKTKKISLNVVVVFRAKSLLESMSVNVSPHVLLARCNDFIEPVWDDPVALTQLAGRTVSWCSQVRKYIEHSPIKIQGF